MFEFELSSEDIEGSSIFFWMEAMYDLVFLVLVYRAEYTTGDFRNREVCL